MSFFKTLLVAVLMSVPITAVGQAIPVDEEVKPSDRATAVSLRGKHGVDVSLGLLSGVNASAEVSVDDVTTRSDTNGLIGSVAYSYWLRDDVAFRFSMGVLDADASVSVSGSRSVIEAASIVPMLFGVKVQPFKLVVSDVARPYVTLSLGPYFGSVSEVRAGVTTAVGSITETALGAHVAVGMDVTLSQLLHLGFMTGYHAISDFEHRIGAEENYSSPEFSLSVGAVFGGGTRD